MRTLILVLTTIVSQAMTAPQQQRQYYNAHSYQYPPQPVYPQYTHNANGYYYYPPPPRPQQRYNVPAQPKKERSYKDICRMVNANGFTNPGGVPKCPY
ncbi:uncharacterized protein LOC109612176 [Musca domestica]|uniref:Uncharacterized protein LOC109612176 n=1 Tax=Musca domestica TaxID=7370 RepID=A0ABM3VBB6_MUSDO|nr:uncharacterized protein LOC109612176 [Musca domestica]